eukprot:scaffold1534_cov122-Isochrysis_galbana.AAC.6
MRMRVTSMGSPRTDIDTPSLAQFAEEGTVLATAAVCMCRPALCARLRTVSGPSLEAVGCSSCGSLLLSPHLVALKSAETLGQIPRTRSIVVASHRNIEKEARWWLERVGSHKVRLQSRMRTMCQCVSACCWALLNVREHDT